MLPRSAWLRSASEQTARTWGEFCDGILKTFHSAFVVPQIWAVARSSFGADLLKVPPVPQAWRIRHHRQRRRGHSRGPEPNESHVFRLEVDLAAVSVARLRCYWVDAAVSVADCVLFV